MVAWDLYDQNFFEISFSVFPAQAGPKIKVNSPFSGSQVLNQTNIKLLTKTCTFHSSSTL